VFDLSQRNRTQHISKRTPNEAIGKIHAEKPPRNSPFAAFQRSFIFPASIPEIPLLKLWKVLPLRHSNPTPAENRISSTEIGDAGGAGFGFEHHPISTCIPN
jgi:hypothetical protein